MANVGSDGGCMLKLSVPIDVYDPLNRRKLSSSADMPAEHNIAIMQSWLKLTSSLKLSLIPGNDMYPDKKSFKW